MNAPSDELTPGEIGRTLNRLETAITTLTVDMKTGFTGVQDRMELMRSEFVHRTEYDVRNEALDREIVQIRESVKAGVAGVEKKVDAIDSRRPQWTAVGAFVVAAAGLALSMLR